MPYVEVLIMEYEFLYNERLGISIPTLYKNWKEFSIDTQNDILFRWEKIRGNIPERIAEREIIINSKQAQLNEEEDFEISCKLNYEIADVASSINDLWLYYRLNQSVAEDRVHL
jgi:hypothetical protein